MNFLFPLALILLAQPETQAEQPDAQSAQPKIQAEQPDAQSAQPEKAPKKIRLKRRKQPDAQPAQPVAQPVAQPAAPPENQTEPAQLEDQTEQPDAQTILQTPDGDSDELVKPPSVEPPPKAKQAVPLLGVRFDIGFPDFAGLDLLGNPLPFLQLHLGMSTNILGLGVRGGVSYIPWRGVFRPIATFEAGHHFNNFLAGLMGDISPGVKDWIDGFQYTYINGSIGFDVGSANVAFTFRVGVSYIFASSDSPFGQAVQVFKILSRMDSSDEQKRNQNFPLPSVRLGVVVYFL